MHSFLCFSKIGFLHDIDLYLGSLSLDDCNFDSKQLSLPVAISACRAAPMGANPLGHTFKPLTLYDISIYTIYFSHPVWRVMAYTVSPKDDPETQFFVFNTVEGESFGVPGFRNGLHDTYSLDVFGKAFETRAADTDMEYSFDYFYPIKSSLVYYSDLCVNIEPVSSENLETVCTVLSQAYADTSEVVKNIPYGVTVMLTYREPTWPENQPCLIRIDSFYLSGFDTNTETIEKYILDEVGKYQERLEQTGP